MHSGFASGSAFFLLISPQKLVDIFLRLFNKNKEHDTNADTRETVYKSAASCVEGGQAPCICCPFIDNVGPRQELSYLNVTRASS